MILFCVGLALGEFEDYSQPVSLAQKSAAKKYVTALGLSKENQDQALQDFLYALFTQDRGNLSRYTLTVYRFLILYSFRREGHLAKAGTITQYISAIVFLGRATILEAIKKSMKCTKHGFFKWVIWANYSSMQAQALNPSLTFRTLPLFQQYISLQSDYPLSPLYHTRNLLKKLSKMQTHAINLNLINNFQTIIIGKSTVTLDGIGAMFHGILDSIKQRRKELLGGIDLEELVRIPDALIDEPDNQTPGFYFGKVKRNKLQCYEKLLAKLIFGNKQLKREYGTVTAEGTLVLNQPRCHRFLREVAMLRSELGTLLHICTSGPYRGTEYAASCIRNTVNGNPRNVKAILGRLCLVSGYNKTTSSVSPQIFIIITTTN